MLSLGRFNTHARALYFDYMTTVNIKRRVFQSDNLFRLLPYILSAILWSVLAFSEHYYLKVIEDRSLFLFDIQFVMESFKVPGGFLGLTGSFLTQFLHLPWLGSLFWVILLLVIYQLTVRAFNLSGWSMSLAVLPPVLLIIGNMSLGYGVFIMRAQDYFFATALGCLSAVIPPLAVNRISSFSGKLLLIALWTAIGFPLLGTFAFTGSLSAAILIFCNREIPAQRRLITAATTIALIVLVPLLTYGLWTSYRMTDSWRMGLPSVSEESWTRAVTAPYQLALISILVISALPHRFKDKDTSPVFRAVFFIISVAAVWLFWFRNENFRTELAMYDAIDRMDWEQVTAIYRKTEKSHARSDAKAYASRTAKLSEATDKDAIEAILDKYDKRFFEPTRTMVLYRDLALVKTDKALDEAFSMKDGSRLQKSRTQIPMALQSGKQLYFHYGLTNLCYRWCFEDAVEHGWNAGTLRYMSMLSILTGERNLALKYLNRLDKTIFYRKWSRQCRTLLDGTHDISKIAPYDRILPLMCFEDNMTNDMAKSESQLIRHFTRPRPAGATPQFDMVALFWAMRIQSIDGFWERLYYYLNSNQVKTLPRSIQEAAILYNSLERHGVELSYSKEISDSYDRFRKYVESHPVRTIRESAYPYSRQFGKTFFYYYYFIRDLQTY